MLSCRKFILSSSSSLSSFLHPTFPLLAPKKQVVKKSRSTSTSTTQRKKRSSSPSSTKSKKATSNKITFQEKNSKNTKNQIQKTNKKQPKRASSLSPEPKSTTKKKSSKSSKSITTTTTTMPPKTKFFAIVKGKQTGVIEDNWDNVSKLVLGVSNCKYKGFKTRAEATQWYNDEISNQQQQQTTATTTLSKAMSTINNAPTGQQQQQQVPYYQNQQMMAVRRGRDDDQTQTTFQQSSNNTSSSTSFNLNDLSFLGTRVNTDINNVINRLNPDVAAMSNYILRVLQQQQQQQQQHHHHQGVNNNGANNFCRMKVFTDGGCSNNGRPNASAGCGVAIAIPTGNANHNNNCGSSSSSSSFIGLAFPLHPRERQTNQRAELTACVAILAAVERAEQQHHLRQNRQQDDDDNNPFIILDIVTDSQHCIKGATEWRSKWQRERKKKKSVENSDLWECFFNLLETREAKFRNIIASKGNRRTTGTINAVNWEWVKGHQVTTVAQRQQQNLPDEVKGNNEADRLAVRGSTLSVTQQQQQGNDAAAAACQSCCNGLALKKNNVFVD